MRAKYAVEFGVIETDEDGRILAFHEKNRDAPTMPGDPNRVYASMGNYIFSTRTLLDLLKADAKDPDSHHDFGKDILPKLAGNAPIYAYDFQTNRIPGEPEDSIPYWRDVGTIDAYYEANMDLRTSSPRSTSTTANGRCAAPAIPIRPPSSPSTRTIAAARRSTASSPAAAFSPAAWCAIPFSAAACASTPARWWKTA